MGKLKATNNAGDVADDFMREARRLRAELNEAVDELADEAEIIYATVALKDTGRMSRGVEAMRAGNEAIIRVFAKNPSSGYDYVGVTRFGHRKRRIDRGQTRIRITPKKAKALLIPTPTGKIFRKSANIYRPLAFRIGGRLILRRSVKGFHPKQDWAERGHPVAFAAAKKVAARLGDKITVRMTGA